MRFTALYCAERRGAKKDIRFRARFSEFSVRDKVVVLDDLTF